MRILISPIYSILYIFQWIYRLFKGYTLPKSKSDNIMIVYFDSGGGHRMTAEAIKSCLTNHNVVMVPFVEVFPTVPWSDTFYTIGLKSGKLGRTLINLSTYILPLITFGSKWICSIPPFRYITNECAWNAMDKYQPSEIISCMTCTNGVMSSVFKRINPKIKYTIVCSDFQDPTGTWEGGVYDKFIVGTDKMEETAKSRGHQNVLRISRILLRPQWYKNVHFSKESFGFEEDEFTVGVFYGGVAPSKIYEKIPLIGNRGILIAGRNKILADKVRKQYPGWKVFEYVEVVQLQQLLLCMDVMIGKPGPGCINEAIASGTSLLLEDISVMYQEKDLLNYVVEHGYGRSFKNWKEVPYLLTQPRPIPTKYEKGNPCKDLVDCF